MSYQTTNTDLSSAFTTAASHLNSGGIFIFDCWYGPAVLTDRPATRVKRLEDNAISVTRIAEPVMHTDENVVDVNYDVFIRDKTTGHIDELKETHRMRYLFRPELDILLKTGGFTLLEEAEWMTGRKPGNDTWSVCFVAGM